MIEHGYTKVPHGGIELIGWAPVPGDFLMKNSQQAGWDSDVQWLEWEAPWDSNFKEYIFLKE